MYAAAFKVSCKSASERERERERAHCWPLLEVHPQSLKRILSELWSTVHSTVRLGSSCSQFSKPESGVGDMVGGVVGGLSVAWKIEKNISQHVIK